MDKSISPKQTKKYNLGIALSGGAARGYAHIGVLKALDENGIKPDVIAGTSMGALVGTMYAAGIKPIDIADIIEHNPFFDLVKFAWSKSSLFSLDKVKNALSEQIKKDDFSALQLPLYVSVSNLSLGKNEIFSKGKLFDCVLASCSIPIIFQPVVIGESTYVDGGLFQNLPVNAIKDKCQTLIGVNVNPIVDKQNFSNMWDITERTLDLTVNSNVILDKNKCDMYIEPTKLSEYSLWDFKKINELVEVGYDYTSMMIEKGEFDSILKR